MANRSSTTSIPNLLRASLLLAVLAPGAFAQLDLPRRAGSPPPAKDAAPVQRGDMAPHLVCEVCKTRNYTAPRSAPMGEHLYQANCTTCKTSRLHRDPKAAGGVPELDLPARIPGTAPRAGTPVVPAPDGAGTTPGTPTGDAPKPQEQPTPFGADIDPAARRILESLAVAGDDLAHPVVPKAVEGLVDLGEVGVPAARAALIDPRGSYAVVGARVLLRTGTAEDAERIIERLGRPLPKKAGPAILEELVRRDPVHGSPALLVTLLDHKDYEMRNSAHRQLTRMRGPELLPYLPKALKSKRVDTRQRAVELLAAIDDPGVMDALLEHHADSSPQVAGRITEALGRIDGPRVEVELLGRAFAGRWILRESAYALLAIVDREDRTLDPVLDSAHVDTLLRGLTTQEPFVAGASAVALAGIGFRSPEPARTAWLDTDVVERLVYAISGREFHHDFSALVPRVQRRLHLITGQDFGVDGPAWVRWWLENRDGFVARRAHLPLDEAEVDRLVLRYHELDGAEAAFTLVGPSAVLERGGAKGEVLRLSGRQVRGLAQLLEREGVLGPGRLPGRRGSTSRGSRTLEFAVGARGKSFEHGPGITEPWFERLVHAARDLRERNRWQRYPNLVRYTDESQFWLEESGWWSLDEPSELERAVRLKDLVLVWMPRTVRTERQGAIAELEQLYARPGVASKDDVPVLLGLVEQEPTLDGRAERLVRLALHAGAAAEEGSDAAALTPELARRMSDVLVLRFGAEARDELGLVFAAAGVDFVRVMARDPEPVLRAVAAKQLVGTGEVQDVDQVLAMLEDPEGIVEAAAALALGEARIDRARTALLVRARIADSPVREASLRAIGALGGDYVVDALVLSLAEREVSVQEAAAAGLAELRDPGTASLLVSLLGQGPSSPIYEHAVRGLERLGDAARGDLERVVRSPLHRSRRAATLLLGAQLDPLAVEAAIEQLTERPLDNELEFELAVLSCVDFRGADDVPAAYRAWWRDVDRRSPGSWLRVAMDRRGMVPPSPRLMEGELGPELASALMQLLERPEDFLVERGRRELVRALGEPLDTAPADKAARDEWLRGVRAKLEQRVGRADALPE